VAWRGKGGCGEGGKGWELASEQSRSTAKVDEESIQRSVT
jgi:hypothetical protein